MHNSLKYKELIPFVIIFVISFIPDKIVPDISVFIKVLAFVVLALYYIYTTVTYLKHEDKKNVKVHAIMYGWFALCLIVLAFTQVADVSSLSVHRYEFFRFFVAFVFYIPALYLFAKLRFDGFNLFIQIIIFLFLMRVAFLNTSIFI